MAERTAPIGFIHQLEEYLDQKPPREHPLNRGHRVRSFTGGRLNRYIPLMKQSLGGALSSLKSNRNDARYVATAAVLYNALPCDWHIGADCRANNVVITLPFAAAAGAGRQITVKDAFAVAPAPFTITVNIQLGDTINWAAGVIFGAPNQNITVISDGITNWEVI